MYGDVCDVGGGVVAVVGENTSVRDGLLNWSSRCTFFCSWLISGFISCLMSGTVGKSYSPVKETMEIEI